MAIEKLSLEQLLSENQDLQRRLSEAEDTLTAIQNGEVDALVISTPDGKQVFSLTGTEHPYRVMVETMQEGAAFLVSTGQIFYSNQQLATLLQTPLEKLIGSLFSDYVTIQDRAIIAERLKNLKTHQNNNDEISLNNSKGQPLTVSLSWSPVELSGIPGLSVIINDISARKKAEQKIQHLNRLYAMTNAIAMAIIHTKDRNVLFKILCQIAVQQGGFRLAWVGLVNPDTGIIDAYSARGETRYIEGLRLNIHNESDAKAPSATAIRTGNYCVYNNFLDATEIQFLHEKASQHGLLSCASIAITENNITIGALSLYASEKDYFDQQQIQLLSQMQADIAFALDNLILKSDLNDAQQQLILAKEREYTAKLLSESERLLSDSQRISHIGSWSYDFINPLVWSEETYRLYGVSADSFIPTPESIIALVHEDDRSALLAQITNTNKDDYPKELVITHSLPDGSIRYLSRHGELLQDAKGHALRMVGTVQDVTEKYLNEQTLKQSEERLRLALNAAKLGVFDKTILTNQIIVSERTEQIWGYSPGEFSGDYHDFARRVHPDDLPRLEAELKRSQSEQDRYMCEYRVLWPDTSIHWTSVIGEYYCDTKDQNLRLRGIIEDVTVRKVTENRLKLAASVFTHSREGIIITDAAGNIIDVNNSFTYISGYSRAEALGKNPSFLKSDRQDSEFYKRMWQDLNIKQHWYGEIWDRHKNGDDYAIMINISAVPNATGQIQNYVALFSDITATKTHQQQLEHIAHFDALTGLPNRLLLADRLEQAICYAQRQGDLIAIVYLDLDGFKAVNDHYGHALGDILLITVAQRMRDVLREVDTLARIGGDEFVAILVNLDDQQDCEPLLDRLLRAAADPVIINDKVLQVSASIGVTLYPKDESDADKLLRHADQAMYAAKQSGKNRYLYFDLIKSAALKTEQEKLIGIRCAMDNGEFVLHYQPKVNIKTGEVIGAEALIRWQHPELGLLLPAAFLPLIENHPYDIELGEWVIDTTFAQLADWQQQCFTLPVSVNIGAHHLQQECFVLNLSDRFSAYPNIQPRQIELEILESSALEDINNASNIMQACCDIGVHFSLDDFGTGYSSLTYLRRLPVNMLKIDQSFVRDMLTDLEDLSIIEGVIGLARAFHHKVIAEGVESLAHCERLLELGCDLAQGYAIARPMPADKLPDWVKGWQQNPTMMG